MKTFQRITLSLLTIVAIGSHNTAFALVGTGTINIEVDGTDSATVSAPLTAATVNKTGSGTAILSGNNSSTVTNLIIGSTAAQGGLVQVSAAANLGANTQLISQSTLEILTGSGTAGSPNSVVIPGTLASSAPTPSAGTGNILIADQYTTVALNAISSGASIYSALTLAGAGVITVGNLSSSPKTIMITGNVNVGASGSKLTTGATTVKPGGLLEIMGSTAASVPGATEIQNGAVLQVAASVAVPANGSSHGDIFNNGSTGGSLKFDTGATLKLGAGSSWARNITVGTAL